jgi:hypothetical protein
MEGYEVKSYKDKVVVSIDKSVIKTELLLDMLEKLRIEYLASKTNFDENVIDFADEIKTKWWKNNKDEFLRE